MCYINDLLWNNFLICSSEYKVARKRTERLMGLLDYAIKIAATWVVCKKLHARIAGHFTLRIQHRAIFKRFRWLILNSVSVIVFQFVIVCLKSDTVYQFNFAKKKKKNSFLFSNEDLLIYK